MLIAINIKVIVSINVCCGVVMLAHRIAGDDWKGRMTTGQQGRASRAEASMPEPKTGRLSSAKVMPRTTRDCNVTQRVENQCSIKIIDTVRSCNHRHREVLQS